MRTIDRRWWPCLAVILVGIAVFLAMPGGFADRARLALHGLCAQTPGHSFQIGGVLLPFDARMTGIYAGSAVTLSVIAVQRRLLSAALPAMRMRFLLLLLLAAMAADGFNSLLTDLGAWHPWTTTNTTRLVTGYGAGVTLAVALVWLLGQTLYRLAPQRPAISGWAALLPIAAGLPLLAALLAIAPAWMYAPIATGLIVSAWTVISVIAFVLVVLLTRADDRITARDALPLPWAWGMTLGLGLMLGLAMVRVWMEHTFGVVSTL